MNLTPQLSTWAAPGLTQLRLKSLSVVYALVPGRWAAEDASDYPSNIGRPTAKVPKCNKKGDESKNKHLFWLFARR